MFELELAAPEVVAESAKIVFAEGRLVEEYLVLVVVDADYGPVVAEELRAHADHDVSDLVVRWPLLEVKRAQFAEPLREEEIWVDHFYLGLHELLGLLARLLPLHALGQELLLEPYDPLVLDLLGVERGDGHVGLLLLDQPLVHPHQRLGGVLLVDGLGHDRLVPLYLACVFAGPVDQLVVPALHEGKDLGEELLVLQGDFEGAVG